MSPVLVWLVLLWLVVAWPTGSRAQAPQAATAQAPTASQPGAAGNTCPAAAAPPSPDDMNRLATQAQDRGFLWRVKKNGRTSYLYGTIHVGRMDWLVPGAITRSALQASDVVALELDMGNPEVAQKMQKAMAPRPGSRPLPEPLRQRLLSQLRRACLPETLLDSMKPDMLASLLMVLAARQEGLDPAYGIDPVLGAMGRALGKTVVSLETVEEQARSLQQLVQGNANQGITALLESLEQHTTAPLMRRMADTWAHSRYEELERYDEWCECMRTPAERQAVRRLLDHRNPAMAKRLVEWHDAGRSVFLAVGSLHLFGRQGLPQLLKHKGFQVEEVSWPVPENTSGPAHKTP